MSEKSRRTSIQDTLIKLATYYPRTDLPAITIKNMAEAIDETDVPLDILHTAATLIVRECEFYPSVSQIITACKEVCNDKLQLPTAEEEWAWVLAHIGASAEPNDAVEHQDANLCISLMGGWHALGMGNTSDRPYRRREFIQLYETVKRREEVHDAVLARSNTRCIEQPNPRVLAITNGVLDHG